MPEQWKLTLQNSSITLKEQQQNPQAVIAALGFYHNHNTTSKYMYQSEKSTHTFDFLQSLVVLAMTPILLA